MAGSGCGAQGVVNSIVVQPVFAGERAVCYRERAAGMYAVLPFSLSLVRAQTRFPLVHPSLLSHDVGNACGGRPCRAATLAVSGEAQPIIKSCAESVVLVTLRLWRLLWRWATCCPCPVSACLAVAWCPASPFPWCARGASTSRQHGGPGCAGGCFLPHAALQQLARMIV